MRYDVARQGFRNFDAVPPVFAFGFQANDAADGVDVPEDEVAAEFFSGGQGLFEIELCAGYELAEGGFADGFAGEIGRETLVVLGDDR